MTTLYPSKACHGLVTWRDFNSVVRYQWSDISGTGYLWGPDGHDINTDVTLAQAERTLRQLGHTIGEWDG